jgi:rubrerythrin
VELDVCPDKEPTKPPSATETKEAIVVIKDALDATKLMASLASEKKYTEIAALFDTTPFKKFEDACSVLTRSDQLSQEDRKSLGTIKRYGVVADAIIMLGGIKGELKQGNVKVSGTGGGLQKAIEDDEEDDEDEDKTIKVNYPEIQRFIKLSYDSIADIYRIVSQIK